MTTTSARREAGRRQVPPPLARRVSQLVVVLLVVVPVVRMGVRVLDGSALQFSDYWIMLPRFTDPGGGLDLGGLLHFQNEHPVVVPQLLYYVNLHLAGGSNVALGLVVLALAAGQVAVLWRLSVRSDLGVAARGVVVVLGSWVIFGLGGTWNFAAAMSGAAWVSANLFALLSVEASSRDRRAVAFAAAVLASASYGTGIAAWPAAVIVVALRRGWRATVRSHWHFAGAAAAVLVWYRANAPAGTGVTADVADAVDAAIDVFGLLAGGGGIAATTIGLVAFIGVPLVVGLHVRTSAGRGAGFVGVAVYGWVAAMLVAAGRADSFEELAAQHRYYSLPALAAVGAIGLVAVQIERMPATWAPRRRQLVRAAGAALAAVAVLALVPAGREHADEMTGFWKQRQVLGEVAFRLGMVDGSTYFTIFTPMEPLTERMVALDHFPFVDGWSRDCGLLGRHVEVDDTVPGRTEAATAVPGLAAAARLSGTARTTESVSCVVVLDGTDTVVGAGFAATHGGWVDFTVLGPSAFERSIALVLGDDRVVRVRGGPAGA